MRTMCFSKRTFLEIVRDPLTLFFGLGFPVVLLLLLSAIQANVPVSLFEIQSLAPGIAVFGLSFVSLFTALIISRDRESAFLLRLYSSPMKGINFILGYILPLIPLSIIQIAVCFIVAFFLGLTPTINVLFAILSALPIILLFIGFGVLFGSVLTNKQVGGICGALLTNLSAWLSGIWFDLDLVGGAFKKISYALPFVHAVNIERKVLIGSYSGILIDFAWVVGYVLIVFVVGILLFLRQMKKQ